MFFIDDILIYSKSERTRRILENGVTTLRQEQLHAEQSKCEFWLESIAFLGHMVSKEGISVDPSKIQAVKDWPVSKTITEIKNFIGLARY